MDSVLVQAYKYDGELRKSWHGDLLERSDSMILLRGVFDEEIRHNKLGLIKKGTISYEYYWSDKWFNIFRFHEPNGDLRNYYCNIALPAEFENDALKYVDLDVDIMTDNYMNTHVLDSEEFEQNIEVYGYTEEIISGVRETTELLQEMIRLRHFPFS